MINHASKVRTDHRSIGAVSGIGAWIAMAETTGLEQYLRPAAKKSPRSKETSRAVMLDVHLSNDEQVAFSYSLLSTVRMNRKQIIAEFVPGRVVIEGLCLEPLYRALIQNRVRSVKITHDARSFGGVMKPTEPVITGISIQDPGSDTVS